MYKPIPPFLTIKSSDIHGVGLYAKHLIEKDINLGVTHVRDTRFKNNFIRTPLGGFFNHSEKPNCKIIEVGDMLFLVTLSEIEPGEELTAEYTLYKPKSIASSKKKTGLIAGNFDVIHPGYVKLFEDAKKNACNCLVIALQGDPTIDRPEKCKPVQTIDEREYILRSIKYVDDVIHYNTEEELLEIVKSFNYDVRIIGSDYLNKEFTGKNLEKKIYYHDRKHKYSLTSLKSRISIQMINQEKVKKGVL